MNHTDITPHIIPRRQWLVAYVQSCLEKKTAERLKAMGVEYYLPIQSEIRQWSDRQESGPPGHPDDDFRACHSAGTPPAAYLTSYQSVHGIAR